MSFPFYQTSEERDTRRVDHLHEGFGREVTEGLSRQGGCGRCASEGAVCGSITRRGKSLRKPMTTQEAGRGLPSS